MSTIVTLAVLDKKIGAYRVSLGLIDVVCVDYILIQSHICLMFRACIKISIQSACVRNDHPLSSPVLVV